ncbi:MAG: hypothetical protein ACRD68_00020 [Pyrinomonadaceae bacterium]
MKRDYALLSYVRLHNIQKDIEWKMFPWEAKAVWPNLKLWVDRAGLFDLFGYGLQAFATTSGLPLEVVEPGIRVLVDFGWVEQSDEFLFIPDHEEQEKSQNAAKVRVAEMRKRRQDLARKAAVTFRNGKLRTVTEQDVTHRNKVLPAPGEPAPPDPPKPKGGRGGAVTHRNGSSRTATKSHENGQNVTLTLPVPTDQDPPRNSAREPEEAAGGREEDQPLRDQPHSSLPPASTGVRGAKLIGAKVLPIVRVQKRGRARRRDLEAELDRAELERGRKEWNHAQPDDTAISKSFFWGWVSEVRRRSKKGDFPIEAVPRDYGEWWEEVEADGCANGRIQRAYYTFLVGDSGRTLENRTRDFPVFMSPGVWPKRCGRGVYAESRL